MATFDYAEDAPTTSTATDFNSNSGDDFDAQAREYLTSKEYSLLKLFKKGLNSSLDL